jgi:CRISPR-associated protein Csb1
MSDHRWLLQATLRPCQGDRFQPTGFPDLGPAEYRSSSGTASLLVESEQSMANRLEAVIWNPSRQALIPALDGLPYARLQDPKRGLITSITEPHRLASAYLYPRLHDALHQELEADGEREIEAHRVGPAIFRRDPNNLLHGGFFPKFSPPLRLPRMLTAFIEADQVALARSGGVKRDRLDPGGETDEGKGNVLFARLAYTAPTITAYFNIDRYGLGGYELSEQAVQLLTDLALLKIRLFLDRGLRLRSACDLRVERIDGNVDLPKLGVLETRIAQLIPTLRASGQLGPVLELEA